MNCKVMQIQLCLRKIRPCWTLWELHTIFTMLNFLHLVPLPPLQIALLTPCELSSALQLPLKLCYILSRSSRFSAREVMESTMFSCVLPSRTLLVMCKPLYMHQRNLWLMKNIIITRIWFNDCMLWHNKIKKNLRWNLAHCHLKQHALSICLLAHFWVLAQSTLVPSFSIKELDLAFIVTIQAVSFLKHTHH